MKPAVLIPVAVLLFTLAGCGSSESETAGSSHQAHAQRRHKAAAQRAAQLRARRQAARLRRRAAARRRARELRREEAAQARLAEEEATASEEASAECDPNYAGACLDPTASDYDCEGGSGDGPYYTGEVIVVGSDPYGLDSDSDGTGCEAE